MTVTMQLNVGANEAGDWANRPSREAASATGWLLPTESAIARRSYEIMIRLHDLRGAVEAMRGQPHGASLAYTNSRPAHVGFGDPIAYRGMRFMTRAI